jgi:hypothetical protein
MNKALMEGGFSGWEAVKNPAKTIVSTSGIKKRINLPLNTKRNSKELKRLIIHEQEVHAERAKNGGESPIKILKDGTANYSEIEDGLAVILECAVDGNFNNASFNRARNRYITAGLALGTDGTPRDARETFDILWQIIALDDSKEGNVCDKDVDIAKDKAYTLIDNAYRGTQFWMKGVIYTKLKIYYEGMVANAEYLKKHIDNLDKVFSEAFIGKYDHTNANEKKLIFDIISRKDDNEKST